MRTRDAVLEPLRGKERTVRGALTEVAERWATARLDDGDVGALEDAVRHLLRRGVIRRELPAGLDAEGRARAFVRGLQAGQGAAAVDPILR